jgi:hypothetical protein
VGGFPAAVRGRSDTSEHAIFTVERKRIQGGVLVAKSFADREQPAEVPRLDLSILQSSRQP